MRLRGFVSMVKSRSFTSFRMTTSFFEANPGVREDGALPLQSLHGGFAAQAAPRRRSRYAEQDRRRVWLAAGLQRGSVGLGAGCVSWISGAAGDGLSGLQLWA